MTKFIWQQIPFTIDIKKLYKKGSYCQLRNKKTEYLCFVIRFFTEVTMIYVNYLVLHFVRHRSLRQRTTETGDSYSCESTKVTLVRVMMLESACCEIGFSGCWLNDCLQNYQIRPNHQHEWQRVQPCSSVNNSCFYSTKVPKRKKSIQSYTPLAHG